MPRFLSTISTSVVAMMALTSTSAAQNYVSGSLGFNLQGDSGNAGAFTSDFTTGDGVAVPPGTVLPAGTAVDWETEFDNGLFIAGAFGREFGNNWRAEVELSYSGADVDTHTNVRAGGGSIDAADAAVLITGSAPLGVTVGELVADGQGDISTTALSVNVFYDIPLDAFEIYLGAGLGLAEVDIEFAPSGVPIIDDTEMATLYQFLVGASYPLSGTTDLTGGYRYRATSDLEADVSLFPASLDIENNAHVFEIGLRYSF